ncbi:MAG: hypothetical protein HQM12_21805 [SAR324 cluster bacterium]|nr:hypothetical protein [SAR324 cluster bacterium]
MYPHTDPIIIALDIDDFLTHHESKSLRERDWRDPVHHHEDHFIRVEFPYRDHLVQVEHVLTPACLEFFRFLFEHETIRVAFFSSGIRERNLDLAQKIVRKVMGKGGDSTWIQRYDVYSREDCFDTERLRFRVEEKIMNQFQPKHFMGNLKKDLRMISWGREKYQELYQQTFQDPWVLLPDPEKDKNLLTNLILIEEDPSYLFPGQEKHLLLSPTYNLPYPYLINYQKEDTPYVPDDWRNQFKSFNTIFYAAGLLNHILERHVSEGISLPEILWQAQRDFWLDPTNYKGRYPLHFFTQGREILRKYNPSLNFAVASSKPGSQ